MRSSSICSAFDHCSHRLPVVRMLFEKRDVYYNKGIKSLTQTQMLIYFQPNGVTVDSLNMII